MAIGRFLAGIAALIWSPQMGKYLLLRRAAHRDAGAGHWECVTGRLDQGEGFATAVTREVHEELGIANIQIDFIISTTHFYRGAPKPENELVGVIYACSIADPSAVQVSDEHDAHHWLTVAEIDEFLQEGHWLRTAVHRAETIRAHLPPTLQTFFHESGFESE
jgi:8-oxo-dGTP diphosphatase